MTHLTKITLSAVTIALLSGCGDTTVNQTPSNVVIDASVTDSYNTTTNPIDDAINTCVAPTKEVALPPRITSNMTLTADTLWILEALVAVENGATLTIEPCTTIAGYDGTGDAASYMIIDKGSKIIANGESGKPITFTSYLAAKGTKPAAGQWGGLTIIGYAGNPNLSGTELEYEANTNYFAGTTSPTDNSGSLKYVKVLNTGAVNLDNQELNGLSMVGVGSGTTIENITVDLSGDDGVEIWGGTVNLTNVTITNCGDDYFDIDDGYTGIVKGLDIFTVSGYSGIEMSHADTSATFDGFKITTGVDQTKGGGIYFKGAGIGGHFINGTIIHNGPIDGALHSDSLELGDISFDGISITTNIGLDFTGASADALEQAFTDGADNNITYF